MSYIMQKSFFLVAIQKFKFVDRRKFTVVSDNTLEQFENTCLSPIGHQDSAPEFATVAANQVYKLVLEKAFANTELAHHSQMRLVLVKEAFAIDHSYIISIYRFCLCLCSHSFDRDFQMYFDPIINLGSCQLVKLSIHYCNCVDLPILSTSCQAYQLSKLIYFKSLAPKH